MKNLVVIDNFYKNPEAVRRYALTKAQYLPKEKLPEGFVGTESQQSFFSPDVVGKISDAIGEKIIVDPSRFAFGVFAKTYASDDKNKKIHVDSSEWTAVLYLSRPEDCQGGTLFYEENPERKPEDWKISTRVGMKFNRMVVFKANSLFHAAEGYFGDCDENCRLLQLFFFKTQKGA
jgi:hypothetical protein